ncbi:MAG: hypothetical protein JNG90_19455 [Planctomycetaceae bacterium]|nr:hypothetical protein [Planctomycetaceae bacterium]
MIRIHCGACGGRFRGQDHLRGQRVTCPQCGGPVMVPANAPPLVTPPPITIPPEGSSLVTTLSPAAIPASLARSPRPLRRRRSLWRIAGTLALQSLFLLAVCIAVPAGTMFVLAAQFLIVTALLGPTIGVIYVLVSLTSAGLAATIGHGRESGYAGFLLGLFFGPLGLFAVCFIDGRPACPACREHVSSRAIKCPRCHTAIRQLTLPELTLPPELFHVK